MQIMERCPVCQTPLINGVDGPQQIEYAPEDMARLEQGNITLKELTEMNKRAKIYYMRTRLCPNVGNSDLVEIDGKLVTSNPACVNYYGGDISQPKTIVETIKIYDN